MDWTGPVGAGKTEDVHLNELPYPEHARTAYCYRGNDCWDNHEGRPWTGHVQALRRVGGGRGDAIRGYELESATRWTPWKTKPGLD